MNESRMNKLLKALVYNEKVNMKPQSRFEEYLLSMINGESVDDFPLSQSEYYLKELSIVTAQLKEFVIASIERTEKSGQWPNDICDKLTRIGDAASMLNFYLTELNLPNVEYIGMMAFGMCMGLSKVTAPKLKTVGAQAFVQTGITTFNAPELIEIGEQAFRGTTIATIDFPKVTTVGQYAFESCQAIQTVNWPNVKTIGQNCFEYCSNLSTVHLPQLTRVSYACFAQCPLIEELKFDSATSTEINALRDIPNLKRVEFGSKVAFGGRAFGDDMKLEAVILRYSGNDGICTLASDTFADCGIEAGTGYVYVPFALIDAYKTDARFSKYVEQIRTIEDYPEISG